MYHKKYYHSCNKETDHIFNMFISDFVIDEPLFKCTECMYKESIEESKENECVFDNEDILLLFLDEDIEETSSLIEIETDIQKLKEYELFDLLDIISLNFTEEYVVVITPEIFNILNKGGLIINGLIVNKYKFNIQTI